MFKKKFVSIVALVLLVCFAASCAGGSAVVSSTSDDPNSPFSVREVKEFERARRYVPYSVAINLFGFGFGSLVQDDTDSWLVQMFTSSLGYGFLMPGIFGDYDNNSNPKKNFLIGIGSFFMGLNLILAISFPVEYQFDPKFNAFYNVNNDAEWPGRF